MNEKIRERITEIASQARAYANEYVDSEVEKQFERKFTELIVNECSQICLNQQDPTNLNYKPSEKFANAIKDHFGIK